MRTAKGATKEWAPATEEQRSDATQIRDIATEGKSCSAL
jgi:hypothetical protein